MEVKTCPLCFKEVVSEAGSGCKFCGMLLEDENQLFCSEICEDIYGEMHENKY